MRGMQCINSVGARSRKLFSPT